MCLFSLILPPHAPKPHPFFFILIYYYYYYNSKACMLECLEQMMIIFLMHLEYYLALLSPPSTSTTRRSGARREGSQSHLRGKEWIYHMLRTLLTHLSPVATLCRGEGEGEEDEFSSSSSFAQVPFMSKSFFLTCVEQLRDTAQQLGGRIVSPTS